MFILENDKDLTQYAKEVNIEIVAPDAHNDRSIESPKFKSHRNINNNLSVDDGATTPQDKQVSVTKQIDIQNSMMKMSLNDEEMRRANLNVKQE